MKKYQKPALDIERFDVEDVITVSAVVDEDQDPGILDNEVLGSTAPIIVDFN
ncbi:MAG: hypothetical protein IJB86_01075 [Clostridia bacterium]|nr:hypothetical protein [Clostridia bacterium]